MSRFEEMKKIRDEIIACKECPLYQSRILPVVGQGNHKAEVIFVGEAPGANEDRTGYPFCGNSGKVLDGLLEFIGLSRQDVYICNLLKCRPPSNRDPKPDEITACSSYLERQIEIIRPKIICSLGRYSMYFLMKKFGLEDKIQPISRIHGQIFEAQDRFHDLMFIPFYHPAVVVYNQNMLAVLKKDFLALKNLL